MLLFILGGMWELVRMQRAIFSSYEFINDYAAVIPKGQKERENTAITMGFMFRSRIVAENLNGIRTVILCKYVRILLHCSVTIHKGLVLANRRIHHFWKHAKYIVYIE